MTIVKKRENIALLDQEKQQNFVTAWLRRTVNGWTLNIRLQNREVNNCEGLELSRKIEANLNAHSDTIEFISYIQIFTAYQILLFPDRRNAELRNGLILSR